MFYVLPKSKHPEKLKVQLIRFIATLPDDSNARLPYIEQPDYRTYIRRIDNYPDEQITHIVNEADRIYDEVEAEH